MCDEEQLRPPTAQRVAARALALSCVSCRGCIEQDAEKPEAETFRKKVVAWSHDIGIRSELEEWELRFIETQLGKCADSQLVTDATWIGEALVVLAWAMGIHDLPPYDQSPLPAHVANSIGFMKPKAETALADPRIRAHSELQHFGDFIFSLHWRLRQFNLDHKPMDFRETAKTAWFGPLVIDGMEFVDDDLAVRGVSLSSAEPNLVRACLSMAVERHRAANWLLGYSEVYSETGSDT